MTFGILLLSLSASASPKGELSLRAVSQVSGPVVHLGDLLENSADLSEGLLKTPLAASPAPGEKLEFSAAALSGAIRGATLGNSDVRFHIPKHIVVERAAGTWDKTTLQNRLLEMWRPLCSDCQLEITQFSLPKTTAAQFTLPAAKDLPRGGFSVPVEITNDGQTSTLWLQGQLVIRKKVPVLKRSVFIGERLQAADVEWANRDVTFAQDGIPLASEITNHRLRSSVRANDILFSGSLEREKAVHRGDIVRVISASKEFEVSTTGVTDKDAEIGDRVALKTKTNRDLTGVVVAKDEVEVE